MVNCSVMRFSLAVAAFVLGCSGGPVSSDEELCGEMGPVCDCNGEQVTGTCEDGVLRCDCPNGVGGETSESGGASTGGAAETGGSVSSGGEILSGSGGDVSTGGDPNDTSGGSDGDGGEASGGAATETGGASSGGAESSGGSASGGDGSGGSAESGGSGSGGASPAMCSGVGGPCAGAGDRTYYCGGEEDDPTCKSCDPGWCNCDQGPEYQSGGVQDACFYNTFPDYSCSIVCQYCLDSPEDCP
jgi:hypothetical protein